MRKGIWKWAALCLTAAALGGCGSDGESDYEDARKTEMSLNGAAEDSQGGGTGSAQAQNGEDQRDTGQKNAGPQEAGQKNTGSGDAGNAQEGTGTQGSRLTDLDTAADVKRKEMIDTYISLLEDVYFDQVFPGDEEYGYQPGAGIDVTSNSFAVYDIDFDGEDELILSYSTTYMAGMVELIYGYDHESKSVRKELGVFPSLTYYDNGIVEEEASHNHGMASDGAFWPYLLHQYRREEDAYVPLARVDAWSRAWREEDYDGNPFPEEVDEDGDGLVYYVMPGNTYEPSDPMDKGAYDEWRDSLLKGANQVQIPYMRLTAENIHAIE